MPLWTLVVLKEAEDFLLLVDWDDEEEEEEENCRTTLELTIVDDKADMILCMFTDLSARGDCFSSLVKS